MLIANHYIDLRKIPASNVIYLDDVPSDEVTNMRDFKSKILQPIFATIIRRNLQRQIDYVIYSSDFPTSVDVSLLTDELANETAASRNFDANLFGAKASITSLTYFGLSVLNNDYGWLSLQANSYMRGEATDLLRTPFYGQLNEKFENAIRLFRERDYEAAAEVFEALSKEQPFQLAIPYWLARTYAMRGDAEPAAKQIRTAIKLGWCYREYTKSDFAFRQVSEAPVFVAAVNAIPSNRFRYLPTLAFRNRFFWGPNGMVNEDLKQGNAYLLSTVLAVTRNEGVSEAEALEQIRRSVNADSTFPKGTFYFCDTKDVRTQTRKTASYETVAELRRLGYRAEIVDRVLPRNRDDIIGLSMGSAGYSFKGSGNRIKPGAICENLTSYGGVMHNSSQTTLSEMLRNGAAGSSGTVTEPYAVQQKFPHPRVHVHYAKGCSLAESFYQSVEGPFQLLIVGDALCQPWARRPKMKVTGLEPGETVSGVKRIAVDHSASEIPVGIVNFFLDGRIIASLPGEREFRLNTSDVPDGYHELRVVSMAETPIQSQSSTVLPFTVDNGGWTCSLEHPRRPIGIGDTFELEALSNLEVEVELYHNSRLIAKSMGPFAKFQVDAAELGRGPVTLQARAIDEDGDVRSNPIRFEILGKIRDVPANSIRQ